MAAVSAPQTLTPPSSSHGGQAWNFSVPTEISQSKSNDLTSTNKPHVSHATNGHSLSHSNSRPDLSQRRADHPNSSRSQDSGYLAPARINGVSRKDSSISESGSAPDSLLDLYGQRSAISSIDYGDRKAINGDTFDDDDDPEHSRWIHRDKLARIESQELQAAGIILPRARAQSKSSRRENSRDHTGNGVRSEEADQKRQKIGSFPTEAEEEPENNVWDLRLPEEVAADQGDMYRDISGGVKGVSRIPVNKKSPLPIPIQHLERDTPIKRKLSGPLENEGDQITYPKSRGRSQSMKVLEDATATPTPAKRLGSEHSPTKKPARKGASASGSRTSSGQQRPKTRSGSNTANTRPSTRSGELGQSNSVSKRPEGDPPWIVSMYKPDPRLPPDQQLLPTVAKRLQQEQWEKEGKFGNFYDTSFRPLNDEYPRSPEPPVQPSEVEEEKKPEELPVIQKSQHNVSEWPLKGPKSPALSVGRPGTAGRTDSYSTMPKIMGTPQGMGPLQNPTPQIKVPTPPEDTKKGGCGCCAVM